MEKQIFVVRHAKSSWELNLKDIDRPLNERGIKIAPLMADIFKGLVKHHIQFISSPANRALTTARIFHSVLGARTPIIINDDLYFGSECSYLESIQSISEQFGTIALFGHNPKVEDFTNKTIGAINLEIPTCAILCFDSKVSLWKDVDWNNIHYLNHFFPKEQ